jgi:hypothetical protein
MLDPMIGFWLLIMLIAWSRDNARQDKALADLLAAKTPKVRKAVPTLSLEQMRQQLAQPTVWGQGKPWKTEAEYRNAIQVAQWDKAKRLAS